MKVLDSASFYTLSSNIPDIFLIHLAHSCYIPSTFEVHSRYSSCILFEFLENAQRIVKLSSLSGSPMILVF